MQTGYIQKYLSHQFHALTAHGLHSPFVFELYQNVIHDKSKAAGAEELEAARKVFLRDRSVLQVEDLGAGSRFTRSNARPVRQIAKNALKPRRLAQFLSRLASRQQPATIIELGTSLGLTSAYLAKAVPEARVISIEGSPAVSEFAKGFHKQLGLKNLNVLTGNFDALLPEVLKSLPDDRFLLYIDGNHQKEATIRYFEWALSKAGENTLILFDDIHWSSGMEEAWEQIRQQPRVSLTLDLFFMGLVYFKKERATQHFKIRYW